MKLSLVGQAGTVFFVPRAKFSFRETPMGNKMPKCSICTTQSAGDAPIGAPLVLAAANFSHFDGGSPFRGIKRSVSERSIGSDSSFGSFSSVVETEEALQMLLAQPPPDSPTAAAAAAFALEASARREPESETLSTPPEQLDDPGTRVVESESEYEHNQPWCVLLHARLLDTRGLLVGVFHSCRGCDRDAMVKAYFYRMLNDDFGKKGSSTTTLMAPEPGQADTNTVRTPLSIAPLPPPPLSMWPSPAV